ncbi:hypothetical protein RsTz2092_01050 [Deferribacterales bacterium RsTz2092]|nr:hypothetical protein AGMMS49941_04620 [Deferribacterales bacterium]
MSSSIDIQSEAIVKTYGELLVSTLDTTIRAFSAKPDIKIVDTTSANANELTEGFANGTMVLATDDGSGLEIGFLYKTADIVRLADLMLMGDGIASETLDDNHKDAATEMANQMLGGIASSIQTQLGRKVHFKISQVAATNSIGALKGADYKVFNMNGDIKGNPFQFRQFLDSGYISLFDSDNALSAGGIGDESFDLTSSNSNDSWSTVASEVGGNIDMLLDVEIPVSIRMGVAKLFLKDILNLGPGDIIELNQGADDPIELTINGKVIAVGEVVIIDGYFGLRIKEIISKAERIRKLRD